MAPKRKHDYSPELQDQMLALHIDMPWSKVVSKLGLTCSKQTFYLHIQEAKIRKDTEFYARNRNGGYAVGQVYSEYNNQPKERTANGKLPPARAVGFEGYNAYYAGCSACFYRTWNKPGAPSVCPRCNYPLQIIYTPGRGES